MAAFDRAAWSAWLGLYSASEANRTFLHAQFGLPPPRRPPRIQKAAGQHEGLAEPELELYCERAACFAREYGMDDPGYLDALVRMSEQALKVSVTLADAERDAMLNRLDAVRVASHNFGYGMGCDITLSFWRSIGASLDQVTRPVRHL